MSSSDPKMAAASSPLSFADGTVYQMSPLSDRDIAELDEWVRLQFIALALGSLPADASDGERLRVRMAAAREAMSISWMSGEGAQIMATVTGMARLTWQSVKRNHPAVTEAELHAKMFSQENLMAVRMQFRRLNMADETEETSENPRRAAKRERQRRAALLRSRKSTER